MQYLKGQCLNDTTLGNKVIPDWLVSNSSILGWLESSLNYIAGSGYIIKKMKKKMLNRLELPLLSPQTYTQRTVYSKDVWYRLPKPGAKSLKIKGSDPISQILLSPCQADQSFEIRILVDWAYHNSIVSERWLGSFLPWGKELRFFLPWSSPSQGLWASE